MEVSDLGNLPKIKYFGPAFPSSRLMVWVDGLEEAEHLQSLFPRSPMAVIKIDDEAMLVESCVTDHEWDGGYRFDLYVKRPFGGSDVQHHDPGATVDILGYLDPQVTWNDMTFEIEPIEAHHELQAGVRVSGPGFVWFRTNGSVGERTDPEGEGDRGPTIEWDGDDPPF